MNTDSNDTAKTKTKATTKQAEFLRQLGYAGDLDALTIDQASGLIEQLKQRVEEAKQRILQTTNLVDLAMQYSELKKETSMEFAGPCPKCGGNNRFHCTKDWFFCRHCHEKRGDAIEFIRWRENLSYLDVIKRDVGGALPTTSTPAKPSKPIHKPNDWNEAGELQKAIDAHKSLMVGNGKYAQASREYLESRGLTLETAKAFKLGCRAPTLPGAWDETKKTLSYPEQMAILLPWFNPDGSLVAVKYRFLEMHEYTDKDGKQRKESKTSRGNFAGAMFGWQSVKGPTQNHVLIITEGEMNAPSLWQAGGGLVDVLSTGTESMMQTLPDDIIEFAKQYPYRIVWADKGEIADNTAIRINASFSMPSPNGQDANDLLKAGKLEKLLKAMLKRIGATIDAPVDFGELSRAVEAPPLLPSTVEPTSPPATAPPDAAARWAPAEPEIIHAGLTWRDAERLHIELKARVPGQKIYGLGVDPAQPGLYRIVRREVHQINAYLGDDRADPRIEVECTLCT